MFSRPLSRSWIRSGAVGHRSEPVRAAVVPGSCCPDHAPTLLPVCPFRELSLQPHSIPPPLSYVSEFCYVVGVALKARKYFFQVSVCIIIHVYHRKAFMDSSGQSEKNPDVYLLLYLYLFTGIVSHQVQQLFLQNTHFLTVVLQEQAPMCGPPVVQEKLGSIL